MWTGNLETQRIRKQLIFEHMVVRDAAKREGENEC